MYKRQSYDELGEIELPNGEIRRCKVLEVDGTDVLVQLFESSAGINLAQSKAVSYTHLDVYKRQTAFSTGIIDSLGFFAAST